MSEWAEKKITWQIAGMLLFETLKNQKSDFLNSNTCFCSRLFLVYLHFTKHWSNFILKSHKNWILTSNENKIVQKWIKIVLHECLVADLIYVLFILSHYHLSQSEDIECFLSVATSLEVMISYFRSSQERLT